MAIVVIGVKIVNTIIVDDNARNNSDSGSGEPRRERSDRV
jgi:hypothetical protein